MVDTFGGIVAYRSSHHELSYEALAHEPMAQEAFEQREALANKGEVEKCGDLANLYIRDGQEQLHSV